MKKRYKRLIYIIIFIFVFSVVIPIIVGVEDLGRLSGRDIIYKYINKYFFDNENYCASFTATSFTATSCPTKFGRCTTEIKFKHNFYEGKGPIRAWPKVTLICVPKKY